MITVNLYHWENKNLHYYYYYNDSKEKISTGSSKTFLRYPRNPPQITRSCNSSFLQSSSWLTVVCVSDLKVICTQSWGQIEALWAIRSSKTRSQKQHSWVHFDLKTLYCSYSCKPFILTHQLYIALLSFSSQTLFSQKSKCSFSMSLIFIALIKRRWCKPN